MKKPHSLYLVYFSDGRVKVGISGDVKKRMSYYKQEARRNHVDSVTWWACAPYENKESALLAERLICREYSEFAITGHREWFNGSATGFKVLLDTAEEIRNILGEETAEEKADLPFFGSHGSFAGLAA